MQCSLSKSIGVTIFFGYFLLWYIIRNKSNGVFTKTYLPSISNSFVIQNVSKKDAALINRSFYQDRYNTNEKIKYILYWTKMFKREDFYYGLENTPFYGCEYSNCFTTANKTFMNLEDFDALMFHAPYYYINSPKPSRRSFHQKYIFANLESPANLPGKLKPFKNFYNWTLTYREDSDIPNPYGYIVKNKTAYKMPSKEFLKKKEKVIAWFVSNCKTTSQRHLIANELKKYFAVDIYGKCGQFSCQKENESCYVMLEEKYKFYLSFENSYCKDYVTEKLFTVLNYNVVPIVYGWADYKKITPPHSVINVEDFNSVEDLALYIQHLDLNEEKYLEYFKWKRDYYVVSSIQRGMCDLCKKLHTDPFPKIYENIYSWWTGNSEICKLNRDLPKIVTKLLNKN